MHRYKELNVWNEAVEFALALYKLTGRFPTEEKYALTSQLRRAGVSVPSNIAEGAGRNTNGEFVHFLGVANGSTCEVDTQLIIAERLDYITNKQYKDFNKHIERIQNMTFNLQRTLK